MTTHERELTTAVDLCTPDGATLDPAARGWSRYPLHRANLGPHERNKRWDYWCVLAGDLIVATVYADVEALGLAEVYWADTATGATGGRTLITGPGQGIALPDVAGSAPLHIDREGLALGLADDEHGTHIRAEWTESDGAAAHLDVVVARPPGLESLNVVIPWSDEIFNFTSKQWLRPASGELVIGDTTRTIGGADGPEAWAALDVGRGRWPQEIRWNWGGGGGRSGDRLVGLQFGAKWTAGTGFTENGFLLDGRLTKIGRELVWDYDWDHPLQPWTVTDPDGQLDVVLSPRFDKHSVAGDASYGSETHQVFGTWSGRLATDDGLTLDLDGLQGFAEEARQEW